MTLNSSNTATTNAASAVADHYPQPRCCCRRRAYSGGKDGIRMSMKNAAAYVAASLKLDNDEDGNLTFHCCSTGKKKCINNEKIILMVGE